MVCPDENMYRVQHLKKENLIKSRSGHIEIRSAELKHRCKNGFECLPSQQVSQEYTMSAGSQQMKVIPKSMTTDPFLQHPTLTALQRRYLGSIANIYSTAHMRRQMKQHYLNVLHTCIQSGQNSACRRRIGDHLQKEKHMFNVNMEKDAGARPKVQGQRESGAAFGKAIHALSRIGDDLWLDPVVKGLAVRTVNSAHSAYACFLFSPLFFKHYSLGSGSEQSSGAVKCKLAMKSVLPLFRCLTSIERNVERCQITINSPDDRVVIQFFCRHGITKTYNIGYQESEALQAVFASHLCPNVLKAQARLLGDMVMHFPVSQEEITLSMTALRVSLRSYSEEGNDYMKVTYTEMSLHPDEFDYFQVGVDSDITFCLKELRRLIAYLCLSTWVQQESKPVCFSVEDMILEASVVLATLTDSESRSPSQSTKTLAPTTPR
ncbi:hypothetical protein LDENG_00064310 [Lucifuga dentata]|nr:hypothetical protein LDENG_00064310 [Lucifuga dentata]